MEVDAQTSAYVARLYPITRFTGRDLLDPTIIAAQYIALPVRHECAAEDRPAP
jgi:hypothetical protein